MVFVYTGFFHAQFPSNLVVVLNFKKVFSSKSLVIKLADSWILNSQLTKKNNSTKTTEATVTYPEFFKTGFRTYHKATICMKLEINSLCSAQPSLSLLCCTLLLSKLHHAPHNPSRISYCQITINKMLQNVLLKKKSLKFSNWLEGRACTASSASQWVWLHSRLP